MKLLDKYGHYLFVFVVAFLQFSNTLDYPYVWDDALVIEKNPDVRAGIEGIPELFRKQNTDLIHDLIGYRPIPLTTFALEQEFFGMDPSIGHFNNVLLFALLCLILYQLLVTLFFKERKWLALMIVLLYAVHPLHTEVVANIKSRDELLQFLFSALALLNYVNWFRKGNLYYLIGAIIAFAIAFLSKENAIAILGVISVYILFFESETIKKKLIGLIPLIISGVAAISVMLYTLTTNEGHEETEGWGIFYEDQILGNSFMGLSYVSERFSNGMYLINRYLYDFFIPTDLVYYSGYNQIPMMNGFHWELALGFFTLIGLVIAAVVFVRRNSPLSFGIFFFLITLSPFLQMAVLMSDTMADRFMFGPSLGLSILVVVVVHSILSRIPDDTLRKRLTIVVLAILMVPYSVLTFERNEAWASSFTLFSTDIPKLENCARAHKHIAGEYFVKYQDTGSQPFLDSTIKHLERCIEISDKTYHAQIELGYNYGLWGNPGRGIEILEKAVERFPASMDPHFYLGNLYMENGDFELAKAQFRSCIRITPKIVDPYFLLANSHLELAEFDSSMWLSSDALRIWPGDNRFRDIRAHTFLKTNQPDSAINEIGEMLLRDPNNPDLWKKLIGYYNVLGMEEEAQITFQDAVSRGIISTQ